VPAGYGVPMERSVLITGAGSGIGLASAIEAARLGFTSVAAVHQTDQVAPTLAAARDAGVDLTLEVLDVTDEAAASALVDRVGPWALVHNAGYMNAGLLEDVPVDDARRQYEVMLFAPLRLVQLALPGMRRRGGGRIVFVSSSIGQMTLPFQGWYDAVKRSLSALADTLRTEVVADGVDVVLVEPGSIDTPLWDKARTELATRRADTREPSRYDRAIEAMEQAREHGADAEAVAQVVGEVLHAGHPPFLRRVGPGSRAVVLAGRFLPTSVRDRVTRAVGGL
jgi:NAD(P)-dependent dehydrogenase (short-subunit alcohol dehydrogenase family)